MLSQLKLKNLNLCQKTGKWRKKMKAMGKVTLTLGLMIIVSLFLTSCSGVVTPEISMGNSNNPSSNNPNSNNYQDPSTDPVEEQATEESATNSSSNNPNSNNYQDPSTDPVEEMVIVATGEPATVEVDTTKPVITGSRAPLPNSSGWNNTNVTVSFSCTDTGLVQSGIAINTVAGKTLTTEGKNQSVTNTGVCIDAAGNTADPVTVSNINIDKTPPKVTITLPGTGEYVLNQSVTATWSATDALSGVVSPASGTVSIDTSSLGTKTFTLPAGKAKDKAGNSSLKVTKSYSVIADTEEPVIEDPGTVYPQKWATGTGTVGDPWANDCIKTALTNTPTGGTIYLRAGYYQLAGSLSVNKAINIIGEGRNKTFIKTANAFGFNISSVNYVTLKGFTIDGAAQTTGDIPIINIAYCDYITLEDIEAKNGIRMGIQNWESNYGSYKNIYAHDNYSGFHPSTDTAGKNIYNTYRDIYCYDNDNMGFADRGKMVATPIIASHNVYNNLQCWDNGNQGIAIDYQSDIKLSNSSSTGNTGNGLYLSDLQDSTISNCLFTLNGVDEENSGILISKNLKNVNFTNIIVKNNDSGIVIYNSSGLVFTSCQSWDDRVTPLQYWGMVLAGTNSGISLINCKLTPNQYGAIYNPNGVAVTVITEKMLAKF